MKLGLLLPTFFLFLKQGKVGAWVPGVERVQNDFLALTRRVTARHILLPPNREVALALKAKIRQQCTEIRPETGQYPYVVDIFAKAAEKYSRDETTNHRGGLLGEMVPQGFCRDPVLDRACFEVTMGEIQGPIETDYGYHLLLVEERTNCPKLDGPNTKLVPCEKHGLGKVVPSQQEGKIDFSKLLWDQVVFWLAACVAGGVVAELSASLGNSLIAN
mmetsp:Transcript_5809/g.11359  ORF Transcript_5809/g.11359 Transcript_5809/m.11359 type:complete len:217 (-) Transcript_5809:20-670(-)|eukprot:scaffold34701_cov229-Amphora_coffeaeformis.AAC.4